MTRQDPRACITRLATLLAEETSLLHRGDIASAMVLVDEKRQTAGAVRDHAVDGTLRSVPDIGRLLRDLRREIDLNKSALEHALRVQRVLVGIIVDASRRSVPVHAYARSGRAVTRGSGRILGSCRA